MGWLSAGKEAMEFMSTFCNTMLERGVAGIKVVLIFR